MCLDSLNIELSSQVSETRTGPLGCSNYDNLDSVSSVLVHSPENKIQLQGMSEMGIADKVLTYKISLDTQICEPDRFTDSVCNML